MKPGSFAKLAAGAEIDPETGLGPRSLAAYKRATTHLSEARRHGEQLKDILERLKHKPAKLPFMKAGGLDENRFLAAFMDELASLTPEVSEVTHAS